MCSNQMREEGFGVANKSLAAFRNQRFLNTNPGVRIKCGKKDSNLRKH